MNDLHKKQPFTVPDGYFEFLPDKIIKQINDLPSQQEQTPKRIIFKRQFSIAAAFIGFFFLSYTFFTLIINSQENKSNTLAQQIPYDEAVLQYVNESDLIENMIQEEQPVNAEQLEDYLINEDIHETTISEYLNQ